MALCRGAAMLAPAASRCYTSLPHPQGEKYVPYLDENKPKNCFRCEHLSASDEGYVCGLGFGEARTIWTGDLALICPLFEPRQESQPALAVAAKAKD